MKSFVTAIRVLAVCLLFAVCMAAGGALSGLDRVAQQPVAQISTQALGKAALIKPSPPPASPNAPPSDFALAFLTFSMCVGVASSYLILRSSWHGWTLAGAMFVGIYGISTVATQIESIVFLSNRLPPGMIRALLVQGAITTALFAPLAVLLLGRWRNGRAALSPARAHMNAASAAWRVPVLVAAFVFLYLFFGYYVAWQNPELRNYYGGPEYSTFLDSLKGNWLNFRWVYGVATLRGLLYIAFLYPVIRMLRVPRWEVAVAIALFLAAWTTVLLLPNPLMPPSVAQSHLRETFGFSLVFGALLGWLMSSPGPGAARVR